jgi:hypothetical protein
MSADYVQFKPLFNIVKWVLSNLKASFWLHLNFLIISDIALSIARYSKSIWYLHVSP